MQINTMRKLSSLPAAALLCLVAGNASALDVGASVGGIDAGVSIGGSGVDASVGVSGGGVSADADVSLGGGGASAGVSAGAGGAGVDLGLDLGLDLGGPGTPGSNGNVTRVVQSFNAMSGSSQARVVKTCRKALGVNGRGYDPDLVAFCRLLQKYM